MKKLSSLSVASTIVFILLCYEVPTESGADAESILYLAERLSQAGDYQPQLVAVESTKKEESGQSQDVLDYIALSKKGARWEYTVNWEFNRKQLTSKKNGGGHGYSHYSERGSNGV